ncbi:MAG: thiamine phosphate synthase [Coxiellaceae bacterium]|nr:thiamine phosphate synthase [Coxiellaceae bacterium]
MKPAISWSQALKVCLVIGPSSCTKANWIDVTQQAIKGGITSVQLREKSASPNELIEMAQQLLALLPAHIPLIINDHVDIAKQLHCAVHIGQSDVLFSLAREALGAKSIIGLSIENMAQAKEYKNCGASYFGVGPVFQTKSKLDAAEAMGTAEAAKIIDLLSPTPCLLIGGINVTNVKQLPKNKAGIAVISAITHARSPVIATQQLFETLE